ncbi:MAG: SMP-30/gluconolactonase/LRE family protein [Actinomycetia bacterium]|nr:SMP-30/gluconolactonase/LRE family protein [Actinomycetes bacterium]
MSTRDAGIETVETRVLLDGLSFPECPRWHDGKLWFSDMHAHRVMTVDLAGSAEVVVEIDDRPSGLGFLPGGTPIVASADKRHVLRIEKGAATMHADLSSLEAEWLNDMVVDERGRAFVDVITHRADPEGDEPIDRIACIEPDGSWRVAAEGVLRPNGLVITADGTTLIHATTRRRKLIAWTIAEDGRLTGQRLWADTKRWTPDGICYDAEGAIWIGGLSKEHFVRVLPSGEFDRTVHVPGRWATACMLGGPDGRTLFMATAEHEAGRGYIETVEVDVPRAGRP